MVNSFLSWKESQTARETWPWEGHRRDSRRVDFSDGLHGGLWQRRSASFAMHDGHLYAGTSYLEPKGPRARGAVRPDGVPLAESVGAPTKHDVPGTAELGTGPEVNL